ncbi:MAG: alpha/beta fold hydrolase, partial [Nitrospirae bacterium]
MGRVHLPTASGERIACWITPGTGGCGVVFAGGFRSVCAGTKATTFEARARAAGLPYARFDYRGIGASEGDFEATTLGREIEDLGSVVERLAAAGGAAGRPGPERVVVIGSSLGAMVALRYAQERPHRVAALVLVAPAFDFFERRERYLGAAALARWRRQGVVELTDLEGVPFRLRYRFLEEGLAHQERVWSGGLPCPAELFHGTADEIVPLAVAERFA